MSPESFQIQVLDPDIIHPDRFNALAVKIFHHQAQNNQVYKNFLGFLGVNPESVSDIKRIPFLPIDLYKTHLIKTGEFTPQAIFRSSGTTGSTRSQHPVKDLSWYHQLSVEAFTRLFSPIENLPILALLPGYLERDDSSLVEMVHHFIQLSNHPLSGFFLNNHEELYKTLCALKENNEAFLLIGVSFALLDFSEKFSLPSSPSGWIMETGGMKGRRKEITRNELHQQLKEKLGADQICSEYGMTELLSQAYSKGQGIFKSPPWMKVLCRDPKDPLEILETGKRGALNIIDLGNLDSCCFIATSDLGRTFPDETFEVEGRLDHADIRGCNLMVS